MGFTLPNLPFEKNAFKGFISEEGFDYHYGKHHATYVANLNKNIEGTKYANLSLEEIIKKSYEEKNMAVFNNSAQHFNHSFFWNCISPISGGAPKGKILDQISAQFVNFDSFKEKFTNAAITLFGSGWVWLALTTDKKLEIIQLSNAGVPLTDNKKPIITLDIWEHAYYIDHRNARASFVQKFWDVINWEFINQQL